MPRKEPTRSVDVIGEFEENPVDAIADYIASKDNERVFILPPDAPPDSIEELWVKNSREYEAMVEVQKNMLENSKFQQQKNKERESKLYEIMDDLRKRFIEVNEFFKDCSDKRRIAKKVIDEGTINLKALTKDIVEFKSSIKTLTLFRKKLINTASLYQPYEQILKDVVNESGIFDSPKDCTNRCDALMLSQVEINVLQRTKINEIEEMRHRLIEVARDAALSVMDIKNNLAKLQSEYEEAQAKCFQWEKKLTASKNVVAANFLEQQRTLDGIYLIYRTLCKRKDIEVKRKRIDAKPQLDFILREYSLLAEVVKEYELWEKQKSDFSGKQNSKSICSKKI